MVIHNDKVGAHHDRGARRSDGVDVSFHKMTEQENTVMRNHTYPQDPAQVYHLFKGIPNFSAFHTKSIFHVSIVLVHNGQIIC